MIPARQWLAEEYERRRRKNARYSLRAFAKSLGVSSGRLSEILAGKRSISGKLAVKLADKLELAPIARQRFLFAAQIRGKLQAVDPSLLGAEYFTLSEDAFQVLAEWQHYAILSLVKTRGFSANPSWIARRLGISPTEARSALERLLRLQLVAQRGNRLVRTKNSLTTSDGVASAALRRSHRQNIEQALQSLESVPVELRSISSITMAIDPKKIGAANERIKAFRRELSEFLESGAQEEVYNLNIQLVPVSKVDSRRNA